MREPQRRIVTGHSGPTGASPGGEPSVSLPFDDTITPTTIAGLPGAFASSVWATVNPPPESAESSDQDGAHLAGGQLVVQNGSNCRVTDLENGVEVGLHRSASVDYNIITAGRAYLVLPEFDETGKMTLRETLCRTGDVVVQRGTLHGWRAGPEGVRWITVILPAQPAMVNGQSLGDVAL